MAAGGLSVRDAVGAGGGRDTGGAADDLGGKCRGTGRDTEPDDDLRDAGPGGNDRTDSSRLECVSEQPGRAIERQRLQPVWTWYSAGRDAAGQWHGFDSLDNERGDPFGVANVV